jgi:hypothetical protein
MVFELGALTVGGISILTIIVSKLKFYVKKNGSLNWGVGCQDKPLVDDDDIEIKQLEMGGVHVLYVKTKHHIESESESEEE